MLFRFSSVAFVFLALCVSFPSFSSVNDRPLLWKVEREGRVQAFLFGSIHYASEDIYPLPDYVMNAFEVSDSLAVELDVTRVIPSKVSKLVSLHGAIAPPDNLRRRLGEAAWSQLQEACQQFECDPQVFLSYQPWLVSLQLTNLRLINGGFSEVQGVDRHFLMSAHTNEKPVVELESLESQLGVFSGLTDKEQRVFLEHTLRDLAGGDQPLMEMMQAWRQGEEKKLSEQVLGSFSGLKELQGLYQAVFVERNMAMAQQIAVKNQQVWFVVVGAGHMLGDKGLVALLQKRGFKVTLISNLSN